MHRTCVFGTQRRVLWEAFIHVAFTTRILMVDIIAITRNNNVFIYQN